MYQFLGRDTLALRCSAQESLFIRKVFRKRDFLWCEINFANPVGLAENHICEHFNQSTSISAAQFASKALAYSITLFFSYYRFFFQIPDSALPVSLFRKWIRKKMLPAFLDFLSQKRIK